MIDLNDLISYGTANEGTGKVDELCLELEKNRCTGYD